ncbi:CesT family type III secretion system chaperone [Psychrilyobacter sp.]|uniref:CesT family type III secretion system chaperone n=1 Tax=Psychrilyobacter sp. TaxID=2586924 RepID=UPI003017768A
MNVFVKKNEIKTLEDILLENGFSINKEDEILFVNLIDSDASVAIVKNEDSLYFELDLVGINKVRDDIDFYKKILNLNTEILPVSIAINSSEETDNRLIVAESLPTENLDENEILEVLDVMDISLPKILKLINEYIK